MKMTADKEHLQVQYFYNSVIEFIYFIILYLESYDFIFMSTLTKHVKFFKIEVSELVSLFAGNNPEEKLCSMLKTMNCFVISGNKIEARNTLHLKNYIFEELILSKTFDLALKGITDIKDICKNINLNNVISIENGNLLVVLQKSSHFAVERNSLVSLLHCHGILGFEGYSCNLIVNYFQNILQYGQTLTFNEIKNHGKFIPSCGIYGMLPILCTLHCSKSFCCKNGILTLNPKSKKNHKQKPIDVKLREKISESSVPVGKIVYNAYGSYIQKWTGEIGNLTESSGIIYCVTEFTDGYQGVFRVYFNKSALKLVSEIFSLKDYFQIRNVIKFDAKYCHGKKSEYWRATKIEISNSSRFAYDESLLNQLKENSELQRKHCADNKNCLSDIGDPCRRCFHVSCSNDKIKECMIENFFPEECSIMCDTSLIKKSQVTSMEGLGTVTSLNQESSSILSESNSDFRITQKWKAVDDHLKSQEKSEIASMEVISHSASQESKIFNQSISNYIIPDYLFVFSYVYMVMADKGLAVWQHGDQLFNTLFLKESVYPPTSSQNFFVKGQKILALIPYIKEIDSVPVASLVYGLSKEEEKNCLDATEFAQNSLPSIFKDSNQKFYDSCCNFINGLLKPQPNCFVPNIPEPLQLVEFHELVISQCKISVLKVSSVGFWKRLLKACSKAISKDGAITCFLKLSKDIRQEFSRRAKFQAKHRRNSKRNQNILSHSLHLEEKDCLAEEVAKKYLSPNILTLKSEFKNLSCSSLGSINSYKSCRTNSSDAFYSCESELDVSKTKQVVKEDSSQKNSNLKSESIDSNKSSSSSLSSCISVNSTDTINLYSSDPNYTNQANSHDMFVFNEDKSFSDAEQVTPPPIMHNNFSLTVENVGLVFEEKMDKNSIKHETLQKKEKAKYFSIQSFPLLKHISNKKRKILRTQSALKSVCTDCFKSSHKVSAYISLITDSFYFYSVSINGYNTTLPVPKRIIPSKLQEKMTLNSCGDIVIIPNTPVNFSHILCINISCKS